MPPTTTSANGRWVSLPTPEDTAIGNRPTKASSEAISTARKPLGRALDERRPQRLAVAPARLRRTQHQQPHQRHLADQRDEADRRAHRQRDPGHEQREGTAGERERDGEQNDQRAAPRIHRRIQQAEHGQQRERHDQLQPRDRALLILELAGPAK